MQAIYSPVAYRRCILRGEPVSAFPLAEDTHGRMDTHKGYSLVLKGGSRYNVQGDTNLDTRGLPELSEKRTRLVRELVETVALTLLIFLVIRFAAQSFRVDGVSMEPGLHTDEYVLVNKVSYLFHDPQRGDVIVFHYPLDTTKDFIKR